ncbi:hypothetical protein BCR43DRAFT_498216 [Syncephalastrum racemosum]|uniref:Uncharacterized protein n=1 Tax=Syncephalastrum racemosum TaxID=13706 RepID=A0A1X2H3H6_SYNRA|nr:hypothetical protein BCR43DRAFT_498216 [Syncephalastrum racemosum]
MPCLEKKKSLALPKTTPLFATSITYKHLHFFWIHPPFFSPVVSLTLYLFSPSLRTIFCTMTASPLVRQWRRFSSQLRLTRRKSTTSSTSSSSSNSSNKSVRFQAVESVFYTHSSTEYDRSPADEPPMTMGRPVLGQLFMIEPDDLNDQALVKNTTHNKQRSIQSIAIHIALRAMR